ncbi:UDP-glucose dehydrogenase family protein [Gorillibacterium sp. sgz5001074]|uniref:UDP-glucose dehydrogenase family protein n=1 Tax=Gorillibacterium sp. sgz5001074 TaxID=3446695 RepID=UPI003F677E0A
MVVENIAVIGTGYVGLVSGTCFSEIGHQVVCVDRDEGKIERLRRSVMPIYEPGLEEMVTRNMEAGRLSFTTSTEEAVRKSDLIYVAVGTPPMEDGDVDRSQVEAALKEIAAAMNGYKIIVMKSTVPVGTGRWAEELIRKHQPQPVEFDVVSNPEFLREGTAIYDTFHMDRIVIGAEREEAAQRIAKQQEAFQAPVLITSRETSELIKYAANAFLATKISFINEMANICEKVGADVVDVAKGIGMDKRIGGHFLQAGIGYGGSCFPKDTRAQLKIAENVQYDFKILRSVIEVNQLQRSRFTDKIRAALGGNPAGKTVAVLGLAFKPNTDDLRDAPALDIIRSLIGHGVTVHGYDPIATEAASRQLPAVKMFTDPYEALAGADALVITTEWDTVKQLDLQQVKRLMHQPVIVDGRNVYAEAVMREAGFRYYCVGRKGVL